MPEKEKKRKKKKEKRHKKKKDMLREGYQCSLLILPFYRVKYGTYFQLQTLVGKGTNAVDCQNKVFRVDIEHNTTEVKVPQR